MGVIILILVAAGIATLLLVAALKPNTFRVQRSLTIHSSPQALYDQVEDLHKWQAWSPWERLDTGM
ncbi:MAG: polyketide cyclase, partial [Asticcacaulis sp.]|nr:polyketide cyclase [Asticcacaulis sp.]